MADLDYQYLTKLITRAREDDSEAFAELYAATYQRQYRNACRRLRDPYLAQDALRQLYVMVLSHLDALTDPQNFIAWLDQINPQICDAISTHAGKTGASYGPQGTLDIKSADILLTSIFQECGMKVNEVPLSTLTNFRIYRRENYILPKAIIFILTLGLLLTPLLFLIPEVTVTQLSEETAGKPQYQIQVSTPLRVQSITATIDGKEQNLHETSSKIYLLEPNQNGTAQVTVTLENQQFTTTSIQITEADVIKPQLLSFQFQENKVLLKVSDDKSGIDYKKITARDADGNESKPESWNEETGEIIFAYPSSDQDIYIPDRMGNILHAIIRVNKK